MKKRRLRVKPAAVTVLPKKSESKENNVVKEDSADQVVSQSLPETVKHSNYDTRVQFDDNGKVISMNNLTFDPQSNNFTLTGNLLYTGQLVSSTDNGVAPFIVTSTTRVANLSVQEALTAQTVSNAAQPSITSLGILTSVISSGNIHGANVFTSKFTMSSVGSNITATGATQDTATELTKQINEITEATNAGVKLPLAAPGMTITVINATDNNLKVYASYNTKIGTSDVVEMNAHTVRQFVATSATKWYII